MLHHFRKYQKYIYLMITVIIVVSFSFFGTYGALGGNAVHEQIAFTNVAGKAVKRIELEEMAFFIGTDSLDKQLYGGMPGPNFLNDGVIRKDLLQTGLAYLLIEAYPELFKEEYDNKAVKEAHYKPYIHPQIPFISSVNAWSYWAPAIPKNLEALKQAKDPLSEEAFNARIALYFNQDRFPPFYLQRMLGMQEKQSGAKVPDERLVNGDFSLFGYHTVDEWFGAHFVRLMAEWIINAAALADMKGHHVSDEQALASLTQNAIKSFQENKESPYVGASNAGEYFEHQLQRMRLDKTKAVQLWRQVLLFRSLFYDIGQAVFVDAANYRSFNAHADQGLAGTLYQLPPALRVREPSDLLQLELYLNAIGKRSKEGQGMLELPSTFFTVDQILKSKPELVRKKYKLEVAKASKNTLQMKATAKDTLSWQLEPSHWEKLANQFPEIALKALNPSSSEKIDILGSLDQGTRRRADEWTRKQIVEDHPEWIDAALAEANPKTEFYSLSPNAPSPSFNGLEKGSQLIKLLDENSASLAQISFDGTTYYKIKVIEKSPGLEVLSFEEAKRNGILEEMAQKELEIAYVQVRGQNPTPYQNSDKSWKSLDQVQEEVAKEYLKPIYQAIKKELSAHPDAEKYKALENDRLTPYRFAYLGRKNLETLQKSPEKKEEIARAKDSPPEKGESELAAQFKWVETPFTVSRKNFEGLAEGEALLALKPGQWSKVVKAPNGDLYFAFANSEVTGENNLEMLREQVGKARFLLGSEAMRAYLATIIPMLKEKGAISFRFLHLEEEPTMEAADDS
jgi:GcvH upstream region-like protein